MIVETHNRLQNPQRTESTRVVLYDKFQNPIFIAVEIGEQIVTSQLGDANFETLRKNFGLSKTTLITASERPLSQIKT